MLVAYTQGLTDICGALNQADDALDANTQKLAKQVGTAHTTLEDRNAILDAWNNEIAVSQHERALFEGLPVPSSLKVLQTTTDSVWRNIDATEGNFVQRLKMVSTEPALSAVLDDLPRLESQIDNERVKRDAGLTRLAMDTVG